MASRYGTDILISEQQVDEAMNRLKQGADKPQFLLSEIYIGVDRPEDETSVRASVSAFMASPPHPRGAVPRRRHRRVVTGRARAPLPARP